MTDRFWWERERGSFLIDPEGQPYPGRYYLCQHCGDIFETPEARNGHEVFVCSSTLEESDAEV